jgi:Mn2+/Fe2+ NRAMP family transporter
VLLVPEASLLPLILVSQAVNGLLLPIVLFFIVRIATDRTVMGDAVSGRVRSVLSWGFAGLAGALSLAYIAATALGI